MSTPRASQLPLPSSLFSNNSLYLSNGSSSSSKQPSPQPNGQSNDQAGPSRRHGPMNGRMNHHRSPRPRPRSVSRSSSSPSPPPPIGKNDSSSGRDKRRSSSSRPPAPNGRYLHSAHSGRGAPRTGPNGPGPPRPIVQITSPHSGYYPEAISPSPSSPTASLDGDATGFSTQYGASASSPGGLSGSEVEMDHFVSARGEETETETLVATTSGMEKRRSWQVQEEDMLGPAAQDSPFSQSIPIPPSNPRQPHLRPRQFQLPLPSAWTVLPIRLRLTPSPKSPPGKGKGKALSHAGYNLTRRRFEDGLVLGVVILGVWKLAYEWNEKALAGEIGLLIGLSIIYTASRARRVSKPSTGSPPLRPGSPASGAFNINGPNHVRDRSGRHTGNHSTSHHPTNGTTYRDESRNKHAASAIPPIPVDEGDTVVGGNGCVWGTEEREYRECLDDGVFFALLLGPLLASAMLHSALSKLATSPASAVPDGWRIEPPIVLPSTPVRRLPHSISGLDPSDAIKALSALATSRRNLVQLFTLCSFVLLVQLGWSLRLELYLARSQILVNAAVTSPAHAMQSEGSDQLKNLAADQSGAGTYWLRQGKWRRNLSAIGLGFAVTAGCIVVKVATAYIGHGVWSDMSPSDIIIATLFYQFSLYVCVRLARRGFTLGELGVVCTAATALFMETVNLTRMKIRILRTPYIKTYRLPTPLLTFQLALIPGSLLAGFLLSPLLYLSRHLAQRPAHRLRFPHEKSMHRRLLALGFYAGAALVCGGLVGTWTAWCLGRNPFTWIIYWLLQGRHAWTRPVLISYWGLLAAISVAGWNRQLVRGRRHRRYVVPGTREPNQGPSNAAPPSTANAGAPEGGISGVAAQMIDAADQKMPVLSVNARRKFFHALAVVMFVPGIAVDPAFTHLSFSVAFAAFNFAEYIRYFALWPFGVSVHLFLNEFLDAKDSGTAILSHFYLLAGCAAPLWLEGDTEILHYFGVVSLGIGDALASIIGRKFGRIRWSRASGKTVEGSLAFAISILVCSGLLWAFGLVNSFKIPAYTITTLLCTLLEAFSAQNDNLILPMYGWAVGTLLGV